MSTKTERHGEVLIAYLEGEIDHHTARQMRETIDREIELNMPSLLILDFGAVTFTDSSGVGLVMGRYRTISRSGGELHISSCSPQIYKMMKLAGIERLAKLEKSEEK